MNSASRVPEILKHSLSAGSLLLLFGFTIALSIKADSTKPLDWEQSKLTYLPGKKMVKAMALGNESALASVLWIKGLLHFVDAQYEGKEAEWFGHILKVVTHLNPKFKPAYDKGTLYLSGSAVDLARDVAVKGMQEFPDDWQLRVFAAMYEIKADSNYAKAASYLEPLATREDIPQYVRLLPATFRTKAGHMGGALTFLIQQYLESSNPVMKEVLVKKMLELHSIPQEKQARIQEELLRILEQIEANPQAGGSLFSLIPRLLRQK